MRITATLALCAALAMIAAPDGGTPPKPACPSGYYLVMTKDGPICVPRIRRER